MKSNRDFEWESLMSGSYDGKRVLVIAHIDGRRVHMEGQAEVIDDGDLGKVVSIRIDHPHGARLGRPCFMLERDIFEQLAHPDGEHGCDYVVEIG